MDKSNYVDIEHLSTERTDYIDTIPDISEKETLVLDNRIISREIEQTISNRGVSITHSGEESINYNKPWRNVIKRRVVEYEDDNESEY